MLLAGGWSFALSIRAAVRHSARLFSGLAAFPAARTQLEAGARVRERKPYSLLSLDTAPPDANGQPLMFRAAAEMVRTATAETKYNDIDLQSLAKRWHYTYVVRGVCGRFYIGRRTCSTNPGDDPYLGSASEQKRGSFHPISKVILAEHASFENLVRAEIMLHDLYDVARNTTFANAIISFMKP